MSEQPKKKSAIRGSMTSLAGNLSGQVARLGSNIIVTHLLAPKEYGIMAIVSAVLFGLQLLSDMGTRVAIIQSKEGDDPNYLNTAWTVEILRGTAMLLAGCILGVPFAYFYEQPLYMYLIPTAALSAFIGSWASTKMVLQIRHVNVTRNVLIDFTAQIAGFSATIAHAYYFHSVWSLITGPLVQNTWRVIMSHLFVEGPNNRFQWHKPAVQAIRKMGRWITVSSGIMFLAQRLDVFLLGWLTTFNELGVYNIAMVLALFPMTLAGPVVNQVLLPALTAAQREGKDKLREALAEARSAVLPIGLLAVTGMAIFAPPFFALLYDQRYQSAGWITTLYMVISWFQFLTEAFGRALLAIEDARTLAIGQATRLVMTAIGSWVGYRYGGLTGFMIGNGIAAACMYAVIARALHEHGLSNLRADVKFTLAGFALVAANYFLLDLVQARVSFPFVWVSVGVGLVIYLPAAAFGARRVLKQVRELKRRRAAAPPVPPAPSESSLRAPAVDV